MRCMVAKRGNERGRARGVWPALRAMRLLASAMLALPRCLRSRRCPPWRGGEQASRTCARMRDACSGAAVNRCEGLPSPAAALSVSLPFSCLPLYRQVARGQALRRETVTNGIILSCAQYSVSPGHTASCAAHDARSTRNAPCARYLFPICVHIVKASS